jgi:hypothetical protein
MADLLLGRMRRWWGQTPQRSLERAYQAALRIKALEDQHFQGDPISGTADHPEHTDSVFRYFLTQLRQHLQTIRTGLAEFRASSLMTGLAANSASQDDPPPDPNDPSPGSELSILEKLRFIDTILARYTPLPQPRRPAVLNNSVKANSAQPDPALSRVNGVTKGSPLSPSPVPTADPKGIPSGSNPPDDLRPDPSSHATNTGVVPRSITRTVNRLRRELNPSYERQIIEEARDSRTRTMTSLRFLALLALLPLVAQITSKNLLFDPLVEYFRPEDPQAMILSMEFEEQALAEFEHYKERLEFRHFLSGEFEVDSTATEDKLRQKATELTRKYGYRNVEGLKNVLADLLSLGVFAWLIAIGREEIETLKSFLDQIVYGLSDSAKAFIIILFTDVFVGYHSPHGWEVLLSGLARHLGVSENQEATYAFIATFPVFLDTLFKYWIFRYLNRVSPSAVATYRTMNE